ncbi:MAG: PLDc N-terminal domain-containing protein [Pirellulaceae bacterium]|nr:PLDc N-terminal domain-containing protein [Pirellulaceae bacterium]
MSVGLSIGLAVWAIAGLFSLVGLALWIWILVDCAVNEPSQGNDKLVWLLLIILLPFIGSLLYFFIRRPHRPVLAQYSAK